MIAVMECQDDPQLVGLLIHLLLFRLGGQQQFTQQEILDIAKDYEGIRMAFDKNTGTLYLRLKPKPDSPIVRMDI